MVYETGKFVQDEGLSPAEWDIIDDYMEKDVKKIYFNNWDQEYSTVEATLIIERRIAYYERFVFIPNIFLVLISYSSFFISHKSEPARTTLGVIPILTSFSQLQYHLSTIPKFSYDSWLVIFMVLNTIFCCMSMIEFSFISYIEHHYGGKEKGEGDNTCS